MLKFDIITIFPNMFTGPLDESMLGRAQERGLIDINIRNLRDYTTDKHHVTDDAPFGGGAGMIMKPEPIFAAVRDLRCAPETACRESVILLTPQGETFNHDVAVELAGLDHLIMICGHYEGFDERVRQQLADRELSIGDYVLTGGELPAMVIVDAVSRMVEGVVGAPDGVTGDSFAQGLLEYPQYTRPADFEGMRVPDELLSGNHAAIAKWRRRQALARTLARRPDLLDKITLSKADQKILAELQHEEQLEEEK
jgi:tRNA (guanine37-N1)-methyltransferase